jgi:hypothetical protein
VIYNSFLFCCILAALKIELWSVYSESHHPKPSYHFIVSYSGFSQLRENPWKSTAVLRPSPLSAKPVTINIMIGDLELSEVTRYTQVNKFYHLKELKITN